MASMCVRSPLGSRKLQRCKDGITRALARLSDGKFVAHNQLRRSLKSDVRDYFDAGVADLIAVPQLALRRV